MYCLLRFCNLLGALLLAGGTMLQGVDQSGYTWANPAPVTELRELSTDRPDQTESPYTVDAGHFQIESDLLNYTHDREGNLRTTDLSLAALNLKVGLTNRVDLQLMIDPCVRSRVDDGLAGTTDRVAGFGDVTTRLKYNFWGNDGGPTACAVMPFIKWPLSASDVRNGETEGGIIFILGYELPAGWGSAVMTEVDFVSDGAGGRDTAWINSITFAHDLAGNLGGYVELFTILSDTPGARWQGQLDVGFTYTVSNNTQLDFGCNFGITRSAPDYQPFVGFSRRY